MTAPAADTRTTWKLDPSHTTIDFTASAVTATMKAASIDTRSDQRDTHLRSADFLDVETHPDVSFRSTRIEGTKERFKLTGDLTIRGTTRPITLDVTYEGSGKDPWGGTRSSFSATGKFDRRDFGLTWNVALETGGILVSNDVKINIEAQAVLE